MFDPTTHRRIGASVGHRASLLTELATKLARQDEEDQKLRKRLLEKAPKELREWLKEDMTLLTLLFQYGKCHDKIYFNGDYGFKSFADVEAKMKALGKAWSDVITIKIDRPESHRVEVHISALM